MIVSGSIPTSAGISSTFSSSKYMRRIAIEGLPWEISLPESSEPGLSLIATADALGTAVDALGTAVDALGTAVDALGTAVDALGTAVDALGTAADALGRASDASVCARSSV